MRTNLPPHSHNQGRIQYLFFSSKIVVRRRLLSHKKQPSCIRIYTPAIFYGRAQPNIDFERKKLLLFKHNCRQFASFLMCDSDQSCMSIYTPSRYHTSSLAQLVSNNRQNLCQFNPRTACFFTQKQLCICVVWSLCGEAPLCHLAFTQSETK